MRQRQDPNMSQEHTDTVAREGVAGYRVLAVLAFLAAAGGLFAGLIGNLLPWVVVPNTGLLSGSLLGYLIAYFQSMFAGFVSFHVDLFTGGELLLIVEYAAVILVCLTLILSLILMLVALFSRRGAKGCALTATIFVFLSYAAFFALWFCALTLSDSGLTLPDFGAFDMGTGAVALVMLLALFVTDLLIKRTGAFLDLGCMLLLFATIFALTYPGSIFLEADVNYMHFGQSPLVNIAAFVVAMLVIYNLLNAAIRMGTKSHHALSCIRYALLLAAVIVLVVALGIREGFDQLIAASSLLPVILCIVAPFAAFLLELIAAIWQHAKKMRAQSAPAPKPEPVPEPVKEQPQQPMAAPMYTMPVFAMPMPVAQTTPAPAPAPAPAPEPAAPAPQAEEAPMSAFERDMIALANAPANETQSYTSTTYPYASAYQAEPQPTPAMPQPRRQSMPAPSYQSAPRPAPVIDPTPYIYDAFISSLTPQEKNEFGDLFIANRHGDLSYLPAYVIGGDNTEFFKQAFVYLGKFRDHISAPLLNKLYLYVSSL